ncbi:LytR/AlgR family response regulator transcription factor [candidate division KSB1 bacterium]
MSAHNKEIIRSIVIDDEPIARNVIKDYLKNEPQIEVIGECGNGADAVIMILEKKPDLVFLDIQMPEMDGFQVIDALGVKNLPFIIFVTAYDQYAIQAFEINALDYLLKPFDDDRFLQAIERVKEFIISNKKMKSQITNLMENVKNKNPYTKRLLIKSEGRFILLKTDEIKYIESASDYVKIFSGDESFLMRKTMHSLEERLNPQIFIRIHRSFIVNIDFIKEFQPWDKNNYIVILKDGVELRLSCKYRDRLFEMLDAR